MTAWPYGDRSEASELMLCAKCTKRAVVMLQKHLVGLDVLRAPVALTKSQARYQHAVSECITQLTSVPITTLPERVRVALHHVTEAASQFIANVGRGDSWA
jgi:hypothetical protein